MFRSTAMAMARWVCTGALAAVLCPAGATTVSFSFVAPVTAGPFAGQTGSGEIRFDSGSTGTLTPFTNPDLEINFSFGGQTFHQDNDLGFPDFPEVTVVGGVPVEINFLLTQGFSGVDFDDASIGLIALQGALIPGTRAELLAPIDIELREPGVVPEPASFGLAGLALLGLTLARQRRLAPR